MAPNLLSPPPFTLLEAQRGLIRRTIETYSLPWIVINEALQNALDAIEKNDTITEGKILVEFNLDNNHVSVHDNGRGFPYDPECRLFYFGQTDKEFDPASDRLFGYQGVGLKVIIYSSSFFKIETVFENKRWGLEIWNACEYEKKNEIIPNIREPVLVSEPSGSVVEYTFPDDKVLKFFEWILQKYEGKIGPNLANSDAERFLVALEHYFRTYTYAGNLDRLLGLPNAPKKTLIEMRIHWSQIPKNSSENLKKILMSSAPPLTLTFENKHWDIEEILNREKPPYRGRVAPINPPIPPDGFNAKYGPRYVYVNKITDVAGFMTLITNTRARKPADISYYQRYLFPRVKGIYLVVGARPILSEYLFSDVERQQFVCAQAGVPTEHKIKEPEDGGELGYLPNIYFAISTSAKLTYGKRQITDPFLLGYVNNYFNDAFRLTLRNIASAFVGKLRPPTPPLGAPTQIIGLQDITTLDGIAKVPQDENMLIAIFYTLVGGGHIQGIKTYYLSSKEPYDGKILIKSGGTFPSPTSDNHLQTIEFKLSLRDLIEELHRGYKIPTDIDLIVVWEDDYSNLPIIRQLPDYGVCDAQFSDLPEALKKLICRHIPYEIPIIVVKEIIIRKFGRL